ncbi:MAG: thioredoxin domain-containing protein [Pyrinomonadaceae bacterium]|nr:thioredoxin domain-containing protein [Pyrinomonadaceae bacterium]
MRFTIAFIFIALLSSTVISQDAKEILAIANGREYTSQDLSPNVANAWLKLDATLASARKALLDRQIENTLLELGAAEQKLSRQKFLDQEVKNKVRNPSEDQIKSVYEANRQDLGSATLEQVKPQIISYLRKEPEKRAYSELMKSLREKNPVAFRNDVRKTDLKPTDALAIVGAKLITSADFEKKNGLVLYEYKANLHDQLSSSLKQAIDAALYAEEALSLGISTSKFVAREITDRMEVYSVVQQQRLQEALRDRLYKKYRVRIFLKAPEVFIQNVSLDDDPFTGTADAPISVVMFTDFQCPACAATYPVLKSVIAEFGSMVRLTVRDFPLTGIHDNAFNAARAANAANKQGKYFQYKELLYKNQDALDNKSLMKLAAKIGLDRKRFESDFYDKKSSDEVLKDMKDGESYGVSGTPTVFVNGVRVRALSVTAFREAIKNAMPGKVRK